MYIIILLIIIFNHYSVPNLSWSNCPQIIKSTDIVICLNNIYKIVCSCKIIISGWFGKNWGHSLVQIKFCINLLILDYQENNQRNMLKYFSLCNPLSQALIIILIILFCLITANNIDECCFVVIVIDICMSIIVFQFLYLRKLFIAIVN